MVDLSIFSSLSGFYYKWVTNCCVPNRNTSHQLRQPFQINIQYGFANETVLYPDMPWSAWRVLSELCDEEFSVTNQLPGCLRALFDTTDDGKWPQLCGGCDNTQLWRGIRFLINGFCLPSPSGSYSQPYCRTTDLHPAGAGLPSSAPSNHSGSPRPVSVFLLSDKTRTFIFPSRKRATQ